MTQKTDFIYLDHVADTKFIAYGDTIEKVFENAALATLSVIADISTIHPKTAFEIDLETTGTAGKENLMVDFLSELLYLFDAEETVLGAVYVKEAGVKKDDDGNDVWFINAVVSGEPIDSAKQNFKTEVKAITYSGIRVEETPTGFEAEVVLDL
ncbi:archease [Methanimicrococcus blatticola]|uniref:Archease family protein n=1 Tax=Methanimicrococcus blatticola TaxID=91560 RepID=A0A484F5R1_9EURY|nr:archease [Methanimicrococcus blatticola]MBZ3936322.1 archease [Methanimicrococcus blatticola]MCC2508326.1 archease [Methanimicrococcus blatticola]TDQ70220.1 archease family protein [Methanimicrococcus blatticola]